MQKIHVTSMARLFLAVSSNFIGETLSCDIQAILKHMWVKQILLFGIIYFTLQITNQSYEIPIVVLFHSILVWLGFLMFTSLGIWAAALVLVLLGLSLIIDDFADYFTNCEFDEDGDQDEPVITKHESTEN